MTTSFQEFRVVHHGRDRTLEDIDDACAGPLPRVPCFTFGNRTAVVSGSMERSTEVAAHLDESAEEIEVLVTWVGTRLDHGFLHPQYEAEAPADVEGRLPVRPPGRPSHPLTTKLAPSHRTRPIRGRGEPTSGCSRRLPLGSANSIQLAD